MIQSAGDYYKSLGENTVAIIDESFNSAHSQLLAEAHSFISDFDAWFEFLGQRSEFPLFRTAKAEYEFGMLTTIPRFQ